MTYPAIKGSTITRLEIPAAEASYLLPILDYFRTLPGMTLATTLEEQFEYIDSPNLDFYVLRMHTASDIQVAAVCAIKHHAEYKYDPKPYVTPTTYKNCAVLRNASELCCVAVMPAWSHLGLYEKLLSFRLSVLDSSRIPFMELRPTERTAHSLWLEPEAHSSTRTVQKHATALGFQYVGRAFDDNSMVLRGPRRK